MTIRRSAPSRLLNGTKRTSSRPRSRLVQQVRHRHARSGPVMVTATDLEPSDRGACNTSGSPNTIRCTLIGCASICAIHREFLFRLPKALSPTDMVEPRICGIAGICVVSTGPCLSCYRMTSLHTNAIGFVPYQGSAVRGTPTARASEYEGDQTRIPVERAQREISATNPAAAAIKPRLSTATSRPGWDGIKKESNDTCRA